MHNDGGEDPVWVGKRCRSANTLGFSWLYVCLLVLLLLCYALVGCHSELLDTFFIVIHKKKLIFLHWYHHVSVLLYCWHSYVYKAPLGILFCVMNYGVHSMCVLVVYRESRCG